jgi:hypothetical protein
MTREETAKAIYLDFEGFKDKEPSLVGQLVDGQLVQTVTDVRLQAAAEAKSLLFASFDEAMDAMLARARTEGRRIAAFTRHELNVANEHARIDISDVYADVHKMSKKWAKALPTDERPAEWTLTALENFFQIGRPSYLGAQQATSRLRAVIGQLERRGSWADVTPVAKAKWTKLLSYNATDLRNLQILAGHVASGGPIRER